MRAYLNRKVTRFWLKLATFHIPFSPELSGRFGPGDEDRLIAALIAMNTAMARAARG